jgi:hypothetical protein
MAANRDKVNNSVTAEASETSGPAMEGVPIAAPRNIHAYEDFHTSARL